MNTPTSHPLIPLIRIGFSMLGAMLLFSPPAAMAAIINWNVTDGNWNVNTNWSPTTAIPGADDTARMNNGGLLNITDSQAATNVQVGSTTATINNRLVIASGATLTTTGENSVALSANTVGTVTVNGTWTGSGTLYASRSGQGSFTINDGGSVSTAAMRMGSVSGAVGELNILEGGSLSNTGAVLIGEAAGAQADVTLDGEWDSTGEIRFGNNGSGNLTIGSTGVLTTDKTMRIAFVSGSAGVVTVHGELDSSAGLELGNGNSTLNVGSTGVVTIANFSIGAASGAEGTLDIAAGGSLSNTTGNLGNTAGSEASATVAGTWTNSGALTIGSGGTGNLTVATGGVVTSVGATIMAGLSTGTGSGTALVRGTLSNTGDFRIGQYNDSMLTIGAGGVVNVNSGANPVNFAGSSATASGTLTIGGVVNGSTPEAAEAPGVLNASSVVGRASGEVSNVNFNHTASDYFFTKTGLSGGAHLAISNAMIAVNIYSGTTTFIGANTYGSGTTINGGTLIVTNGTAAGTGALTLAGGVLEVNVGSGTGILSNVGNTITFTESGSGYILERANGTNYAAYTASSNITGGTNTTATLLAGTAAGARTLTTALDIVPSVAATNDGVRVSDVFSLSGTTTDLFVLQLQIADVESGQFLGWLDATDTWVNAVTENTDNNASGAQQGFEGTFAGFQGTYGTDLSDYIGAYGFDTGTDSVWAVLNHNSEFAIIPEPSSLALLLGAAALILGRRRSGGSAR